jgi:hypothetical protein
MPDLNTRIAASVAHQEPGKAMRITTAIRTLDRVGIQAAIGSKPTVAEMDEALRKAAVTDPVKRIEFKVMAERLAAGIA